jgi:hypothetical protein
MRMGVTSNSLVISASQLDPQSHSLQQASGLNVGRRSYEGLRARKQSDLSDAVLETAAARPVSDTPDIWHRLPATTQRLDGHNAALPLS